MEPNPSKIEDALEATQPEQFDAATPEREDGTPDATTPKIDLTQPQVWVRVPGPDHVPNLPKPGDISIEWSVQICNSQGVVFTSQEHYVKRQIDGPNHAKTVAQSIQKVLEGSLYEPMIADVQAYGARRLDEIAAKTQTLRDSPVVPQLTAGTPEAATPPPYTNQEPVLPPPPNPSAKL